MTLPRRKAPTIRWVALAAVTVFSSLFLGNSAIAHDFLVSSSPALNQTVNAPLHEVVLTFNDVVLNLPGTAGATIVEVTNQAQPGRYFESGCPTLENNTVSVPVELGESGKYSVTWRIVSADGHPVSDSIQFNYLAAKGNNPSSGTLKPACHAPKQTTGSGYQSSNTSLKTPVPTLVWIALGLALGVIVFIGVLLAVLSPEKSKQ